MSRKFSRTLRSCFQKQRWGKWKFLIICNILNIAFFCLFTGMFIAQASRPCGYDIRDVALKRKKNWLDIFHLFLQPIHNSADLQQRWLPSHAPMDSEWGTVTIERVTMSRHEPYLRPLIRDNLEIEWKGIAWWKSRKLRLRQISQYRFQIAFTITIDIYRQWNPLQRKPPRICEYFIKPTPVVSPAAISIRLSRDPDGNSFNDIFSAHVLELGRNTEQGIHIVAINIDIHDNVLQSLHRWPQHIDEAGPDIPWVPD